MIRITGIESSDSTTTFKLEGKLLGPWVGELRNAFEGSRTPPDRVLLDLSALTFADEAGLICLRSMIRDGASLVACSGFVGEMLKVPQRGESGSRM
jgi:hypothetical protein